MAVGERVHPQAAAWLGMTEEALAGSASPAVLMGDADGMCQKLTERRETLGISYVNIAESFVETFAGVVQRLNGK